MLITGVTGNVGRELANCLIKKNVPFRAASRHPSLLRKQFGSSSVDCRALDFENPETFPEAFEGIRTMFLMRPPKLSHIDYIEESLKVARDSGVRHIVFLSFLGAEKMPFLPHRKIERMIMDMGFDFTFLRTSFFMQNLVTTHLEEIREQHHLYIPAGRGELSFIDIRDVADVACHSLINKKFRNEAFKITGKQALNYEQIADILSTELGYTVTYKNPTKHEFLENCEKKGVPADYALMLANLYTSAKNGFSKRVTIDTERILGREPREFWQFVQDYKELFEK